MASAEPTPFDDLAPPSTSPRLTTQSLIEAESALHDPSDMNMVACIRRFIAVESRLDALEAEEKVLKHEKAQLSDRVIELMIEDEMDSPPGVDGMTAYLKPVQYVKRNIDPDTAAEFTSEQVIQALLDSGLKSMVKAGYNGNQLRALLSEYNKNGSKVPQPLADVVTLEKRRQLAVTPMAMSKQAAAPRRVED